MAGVIPGPRKQRTRQHVIADLSVHYVEGFILEAGHTAQRLGSDYGYDLLVSTFDEQGYVEPGSIYCQIKATETLEASGTDYLYDLDIRDYNLWVKEKMPVVLVLFDASRRRAYWLAVQQYFKQDVAHQPRKGAKRVRVRVPKQAGRKRPGHCQNARTQMASDSPRERGRLVNPTNITYRQLDKVLRSLGFTYRPAKHDPPGHIYEHTESGAVIMLPALTESDMIFEYQLAAVRTELDNFGLADPSVLAAKLQKAG